MKSLIKYLLLTSVRNRLYIGLFTLLTIAFAISLFLGSTALIEQEQMSAVYAAGSSRVILAIGMILFVCLNVHRSFENREVEFIISKPISREKFVLGYLFGFLFAGLLIIAPLIVAILLLTAVNKIGLLFWCLSLVAELVIVICFSLLASLILSNSFSAIMASFGFYILSRMMGLFLLAAKIPQNLAELQLNYSSTALKFLSVFFPRLDLFGQSSWLVNGVTDFFNLKVILWQSLIYIPLLIFMALRDFKCKQF